MLVQKTHFSADSSCLLEKLIKMRVSHCSGVTMTDYSSWKGCTVNYYSLLSAQGAFIYAQLGKRSGVFLSPQSDELKLSTWYRVFSGKVITQAPKTNSGTPRVAHYGLMCQK